VTERFINIAAIDDRLDELDEEFRIRLSGAVNGTILTQFSYVRIADDDFLVAPPAQANAEGNTISPLPILGNSTQYDKNGGIFTATGLPHGLGIDAATGIISGRIKYDAAGTHEVTVSLGHPLVPSRVLSSVTFSWSVANTDLTSLTASEWSTSWGQVLVMNSVTDSGGGNPAQLNVLKRNDVMVSWTHSNAATAPLASEVLFVVDGGGVSPSSGAIDTPASASTDPPYRKTIAFDHAFGAIEYTVHVGIDANGNGTLETAEYTHAVLIRFIDFAVSKPTSRRTGGAGPVEPVAYPILADEHFDTGSTFQFGLDIPFAGSSPLIKYQLYFEDSSFSDTMVAQAAGGTLAYPFAATSAGEYYVLVYYDENSDGVHDGYEDSQQYNDRRFQVMVPRVWSFGVWYSSKLGAAPNIAGELAYGEGILLSKDSAEDRRAIANLRLSTAPPYVWTPGATLGQDTLPADPVPSDDSTLLNIAPDNTIIVAQMLLPDPGYAIQKGRTADSLKTMQVNWTQKGARTVVHEIGHMLGLVHTDDVHPNLSGLANYIMASGPASVDSANLLLKEEADKFE
jgi:hypothetical protein